MSFATLQALHALIGDSLRQMESVYRAKNLDYPALDKPYYSTAEHTPEEDEAIALTTDNAVLVASTQIVSACGQLVAAVHKPFFSLVEGAQAGHIPGCLEYLEASHTVEILRAAGPDGLNVTELARQIDELREHKGTTDPGRLSHVLRLLATYHWIKEVKPDVFANNRLSSFIDSGKTPEQIRENPQKKYDETNGMAAFVGMSADDVCKGSTRLAEWLLTDRTGVANLSGPTYRSPFNLQFNTHHPYYEWLEQPEAGPTRLARFGHAMNGTRDWELTENIIDGFPWADLRKDSVIVDIGGGIGSVSMAIARRFPDLRFVVQDRANVCAIGPSSWGPKYAEVFDTGRITFAPQDFFEPQAPVTVKGVGTVTSPDVYILRAVAHNWPNDDVIKILKNLRAGAAPHTKLLLVDNLLAYACPDDASGDGEGDGGADMAAARSLVPSGSPLLANLGRASANGYLLDLTMMVLFDALERTYREMEGLARASGWKVTRVKRGGGSLWGYMTAEPV